MIYSKDEYTLFISFKIQSRAGDYIKSLNIGRVKNKIYIYHRYPVELRKIQLSPLTWPASFTIESWNYWQSAIIASLRDLRPRFKLKSPPMIISYSISYPDITRVETSRISCMRKIYADDTNRYRLQLYICAHPTIIHQEHSLDIWTESFINSNANSRNSKLSQIAYQTMTTSKNNGLR